MDNNITSKEQAKAITTKGNEKFTTRLLNDNQTGYETDAFEFEGLINTNTTIKQTVTEIGADNNPRFRVIRGPVTITGTIKLIGVHIKDFAKLFSIEYDPRYGLRVGQDIEPKHISISFLQKCSDNSVNKIIMYDCIFEIPSIATVTDDGSSVADYTVSFSAAPIRYSKQDGTEGSITYAIINNIANKEGWDANKELIQYPSEWTTPEPSEPGETL